MGQKISAINGVKSDNFTEPGNAVNEIWFGNTEIISRLPFGDNDMEQAGFPSQGMPKIPWHNFIIPLKRALEASANSTHKAPTLDFSGISKVPASQIVCCNQGGCITDQRITKTAITWQLINQNPSNFWTAFALTYLAYLFLMLVNARRQSSAPEYNAIKTYKSRHVRRFIHTFSKTVLLYVVGIVLGLLAFLSWCYVSQVYQFETADWLTLRNAMHSFVIWHVVASTVAITSVWWDLVKLLYSYRRNWREECTDIEDFKVKPPVGNAPEKRQPST